MYTISLDKNIKRLGRSIVVDLTDSNLPHNLPPNKTPHMTLLFSKEGFPVGTLDNVKILAVDFEDFEGPIEYTLQPWGKRSFKIEGKLRDFFYSSEGRYTDVRV